MVKFSSIESGIAGRTGSGSRSRISSDDRMSFRQLAAMGEKGSAIREGGEGKGTDLVLGRGDRRGYSEGRKKMYQEASDYLTEVVKSVREDKPFAIEPALTLLEKIADIQTPFDALFLKAIHSDDSHNFVVNHSVNLAIYAMKMAETLGYTKTRQVEVGLLGLFHDIGMAFISDDIVYKKERLSDSEFDRLKERPTLGYEVLKQFEEDYPFLAEGTLQVYEKIDGSGYPKGLIGEEINEYAQIVGLVDVYEALIHTRPQRQRYPHFFAVKEIIRTGKGKYQRKFLKALLNTFSIFPLLSYVRLNSKAIGQVIKTYPDQPMRPKIRVIYDSQKQRVLTERVINLPENPLLYITDSISEEELLAISESSELVSPKGDGSASSTEGAKRGNDGSARSRRGKGGRKRRWSFFRVGWAPMAIAFVFFLSAAILNNYGLITKSSPNSTDMVASAIAQQREEKVHLVPEVSSAPLPETVSEIPQEKPIDVNAAALKSSPGSLDNRPADPVEPVEMKQRAVSKDEKPLWKNTYPFSIKFASHKKRADAVKSVSAYTEAGIPAYWVKVDLGGDGIWYRVFSGCFESESEAEKYIEARSLNGVRVKKTGFATLAGSFKNATSAEAHMAKIASKGFSPYMVEKDSIYNVLVGAFYTHQGAEDQHSELLASGIPSHVIQR